MSADLQALLLAGASCPSYGAVRRRSPNFEVEHLQRFCGESLRRLLARLFPLPGPRKRPALTAQRRSGLARDPLGFPAGNFVAVAFKE